MQMLTALFGSLRGVFSKTYLLVGLLPAAAILLSWDWYVQGEVIGTLMREDKVALASVLMLAAKLVGLGLLFYIMHQPLLRFFESIPGKTFPVEQLRQFMVERQLQKLQQIKLEVETRHWESTAVTWPEQDLQLGGNYVPIEVRSRSLSPQAVLRASRKARDRLQIFVTGDSNGTMLPLLEDINIIIKGLRQLLELSRRDSSSHVYQEEQKNWHKLYTQNDNVKEVLKYIERHVDRLWAEAEHALSAFPKDEQWMQPTSLGNRIAALDDYAEQRYGISTGTLWARLWGVIQEDNRKDVTDAQLMVHMLLNLSVASAIVFAMAAVDTLYTWHLILSEQEVLQPNWLTIVFIAMAALLSRGFYLSAVAAFRSVHEHITRLVDMNRSILIERLGFRAPQSLAQEKQFFKDLGSFFTDGTDSIHQWPFHNVPVVSSDVVQKQQTILVEQIMIPKHQITLHALSTAPLTTVSVVEVVERLSRAKQSALPVLDEKAHLIYVLPKGELERFLAQKASIAAMEVPQIHGLKLTDLLNENPSLRLFFKSNFVTVSRDASLADAQKSMHEIPNCLDVFITEDGKKASPLIGWVTNVQIAEAIRA